MPVLTLKAKLDRSDANTPWGFRMQGGKDFSAPLSIQRVTPGSLAAKCGIQVGDSITHIGGHATENLKHKDAQSVILGSGNYLELTLLRGGSPASSAGSVLTSVPPLQQVSPLITQQKTPSQQSWNAAPKPFSSAGSADPLVQKTAALSLQSGAGAGRPGSSEPVACVGNVGLHESSVVHEDNNPSVCSPFQLQPAPPPVHASPMSDASLTPESNIYKTKKPAAVAEVVQSSPPVQSARYEDPEGDEICYRGYTNPNLQSRTFKKLESALETGEEWTAPYPVGKAPVPKDVDQSKGVKHAQFNSPMGLYSKSAANEIYTTKASQNQGDEVDVGPKVYHPSDTYRLVHGLSAPSHSPVLPDGPPAQHQVPSPARAFNPRTNQPAPVAQRPLPTVAKPWQPKQPTGPRKMRVGRAGEARQMGAGSTGRIPVCAACNVSIRGPFVLALDQTWCPDHFACANPNCRAPLVETGFVEEGGQLFCARDYEQFFAPRCAKCSSAIIGDCINALQKTYHPHCFVCGHCRQPIPGGSFHLEDGLPYCERDWQALYQTKCIGCSFPIEPGDKWVEALGQNWHSECFNCSTCQVNLEGQPFYAKGGRPYCKKHAKGGY